MVATGVGYEGVKQGAFHQRAAASPVAGKAYHSAAKPKAKPRIAPAVVIPTTKQPSRDQKPFRRAAVKARQHEQRTAARPPWRRTRACEAGAQGGQRATALARSRP